MKSITSVLRKTISFILAFAVFFNCLPIMSGTMEASAAASYWKNFKVESASHSNTITWERLTNKQQKKIDGIAIFQGTNETNLKCVKRIGKTKTSYVNKNVKAGVKYYYVLTTYKTIKAKQKQYYNKSSKKWVARKPAAKKWGKCPSGKYKGKKTRKVKVTSYEYSNESPLKCTATKKKSSTSKPAGTDTDTDQTVTQLNTEPKYSYKIKFFVQPYTGGSAFFLETNNSNLTLWDPDREHYNDGKYVAIETLDAEGKDVSYYVTPHPRNPTYSNIGHYSIRLPSSKIYDDIKYTRYFKNDLGNYQGEVQGGYMGYFAPPSSGVFTIRIREYSVNGNNITSTKAITLGKVNVLDQSKEYKAWMQQVINNNTDSSMTKPEKMLAICKYLRSIAHYPDCLTPEAMTALEQRYDRYGMAYITSVLTDNTPAFVSHIWDSYTSPYCLEDFGEMLGYPVRSLYWDYPQGSGAWAANHYLAESTEDGSIYLFCPSDKTEYDLDEINMIEPISYRNYWLVLG